MARAETLQCLHLLSSSSFFMLLLLRVIGQPNGIKIKLIHRDSPESPLYPGHITCEERIRRLVHQSIAYTHHLAGSKALEIALGQVDSESPVNPTAIRPRLDLQISNYMVEVGIGTFKTRPPSSSYESYFLLFDTGSSLTWTQCESCKKLKNRTCFRQQQPLFPNSLSRTYRPLPCNKHPLCHKSECINKTCSYLQKYANRAASEGFLASETFTFRSDKNNGTETIKNLVFGCGFDNVGFKSFGAGDKNRIAGILGMGWEDRSFVNQIKSSSQGHFSYCLPPLGSCSYRSRTFLRFGTDILRKKSLRGTSLLPELASGQFVHYYVPLLGISVGGERLPLPPDTFAQKKSGYGGCIIDSGNPFSLIVDMAYNVLKETLANHLSRSKFKRTRARNRFELCYERDDMGGTRNLPKITFHMQGGSDLVIRPEGTYFVGTDSGKQYFCLAMLPSYFYNVTIIGAYQQANQRFVFDTVHHKLYFGPENCARRS